MRISDWSSDVCSSDLITEAGLRALWRSPPNKFPAADGAVNWEIWLDQAEADAFLAAAPAFGVTVAADRLHFPEDLVAVAQATREAPALAVRRLGRVRALAAPTGTADCFDSLEVVDQAGRQQNFMRTGHYDL